MSKSRKKHRVTAVRHPALDVEPSDRLASIVSGGAMALFVARLLVPAEATTEGDTLWIVQLWLVVGLLWAWHALRSDRLTLRFDLCDAALALLTGGHLLSGFAVLLTEGHKRAAINGMWEWIGLLVSFFLFRQSLDPRSRRVFVLMLIAVAVSLSLLGFWQHFVFYPQAAAQYQGLLNEFTALQQGSTDLAPPAAHARLLEVQSRLLDAGVPLEGPAQQLWQDRLSSSTEPFGPFALANTFAGVLLVTFLITLGVLQSAWIARRRWLPAVSLAVAAAIIGYCLILTKSRTAFVGFLAGLAVWGFLLLARPGAARRRILFLILATIVVVGVLIAVAFMSGGLDQAVISEAPKSLEYRWQFWTGTWGVIRENPLMGVGLGNFRSHYLKHKLAESSEEIVDPHNFFLDVWVNGGVLALLGVLSLLVVGLMALLRASPDSPSKIEPQAPTVRSDWTDPILWGAGIGYLLVFAKLWFLNEGLDWQLVLLAGIAAFAFAFFRTCESVEQRPSLYAIAALAAVSVHLLGAGGIEMPVIVQAALFVMAVYSLESVPKIELANPRRAAWGFAALSLLLGAACWWTATSRVLVCDGRLREGDAILVLEGDTYRAERTYREAADADPLNPDPRLRLADTALARWNRLSSDDPAEFNRAVAAARDGIALDPYSARGYAWLGKAYGKRFARTGSLEDAELSAAEFQIAVDRYPTNPFFRDELAAAFVAAGKQVEAAQQAAIAIELDEINHRQGHRDKYLPDDSRERLEKLKSGAENSGQSPGD